jgi:hypothetical protein
MHQLCTFITTWSPPSPRLANALLWALPGNMERYGSFRLNPPLQGEVDCRRQDGGVTAYREGDTPPSPASRATPPLAGEDRIMLRMTANILTAAAMH